MKLDIKYGNLEGPYFTKWRIEDLEYFATDINKKIPNCSNFEIWYDPQEDYHNLKFVCNDKIIVIKYYKVLSTTVNNVSIWQGCPYDCRTDLICSIMKAIDQ